MAMFEAATKCIAKSIGSKTLHHVSDLNSSERFKLLCVVCQKKSFWPWKKTQIFPTQIVLQDILSTKLNIEQSDVNFTLVKDYIENPTLNIKGDVGAKIASELQLEFSASDSVSLNINVGSLQKQEIKWQKLDNALQSSKVNTRHPLLEEIQFLKRTELAVVLESISTCADSTLSGSADLNVTTDDSVSNKSVVVVDVHTKDSIEKKTTHSYTLPSNTVLAFSCNTFSVTEYGGIDFHAAPDEADFSTKTLLQKTKKDSFDFVKSMLFSFVKSSKFSSIQQFFKSIIGSVEQSSLEAIYLLLLAVEGSSENNFYLNSCHSALSKTIVENIGLWKPLLLSLNFFIPDDLSLNKASIKFPTNDDDYLVKGCIGWIDAILDTDKNLRHYLVQFSDEHLKLLLHIVESKILNKEINEEIQINLMFSENQSTKLFLNGIGFVFETEEEKEVMTYPSEDHQKLLDAFINIYLLSA
ncbi:uncharacterized protein LOC100201064 isoform X1 [Hydra vulgaris]|uniref:uncharacterized protein LOC100201064 isoform X1 n=1 Tax=Hydra vulgaris TaxID=6087 RepID=UPI001F5E9C25|nr:uncharacterized protein LOC100201064 [Hydra vulgaris]